MKNYILISILLACFSISTNAWSQKANVFHVRAWAADFSTTTDDGGWNEDQDYDVEGDSTLIGITYSTIYSNGDASIISVYTGSVEGEHDYLGGDDYEASRLDFEYLLRNKGSGFDTLYGLRIVSFDEEFSGAVNQDTSSFFVTGEYGFSKSLALDERNRHAIFGGLVFAVGFNFWSEDYKTESESDAGMEFGAFYDFNVGYNFQVSREFGAQVRYRTFNSATGSVTIDGIEFTISYYSF